MSATVENPFAPPVTTEATPSAMALGQREVAEIQAALVIAKKFRRDPREAMDRILMACTRPTLADQAVYQYARGGEDITGPSIRLAEELARGWGNILSGITELSRSNGASECLAYCWDLEANYRDEKRFQVKHWRDTRNGGYALKDERDIYEVVANQGARRKRACILAIIPGDVVEAAVNQCDVTLKATIDVTPERIVVMIEKFAVFGVTKEHIETRIQRRIDAMTPALFVSMQKIYNSLRDGMSSAADWFDVPREKPSNTTSLSAIKGAKPAETPASEPAKTEPADDGEQSSEITAAAIAKMIEAAKSDDHVIVAMDLIRELPEDQRSDLKKQAIAKMQEIMG